MEEREFWFRVWAIVALVVMAIVTGLLIYFINTSRMIGRMAVAGVDPIIAACSMNSIDRAECTAAIAQGRR